MALQGFRQPDKPARKLTLPLHLKFYLGYLSLNLSSLFSEYIIPDLITENSLNSALYQSKGVEKNQTFENHSDETISPASHILEG